MQLSYCLHSLVVFGSNNALWLLALSNGQQIGLVRDICLRSISLFPRSFSLTLKLQFLVTFWFLAALKKCLLP